MKFGVFDHMDRAGGDLGRQFEDRLKLIELYEKHGFHVVALGVSPAPELEPDVEYRWVA